MAKTNHRQEKAIVPSIDEYKALCKNNLAEALGQLAFMEPGKSKIQCKEYLSQVDGISQKLKQLLNEYLSSSAPKNQEQKHLQHQAYATRQLLSLAQNLLKETDLHLSLINKAESITKYYFEYMHIHGEWLILLYTSIPLPSLAKLYPINTRFPSKANPYLRICSAGIPLAIRFAS